MFEDVGRSGKCNILWIVIRKAFISPQDLTIILPGILIYSRNKNIKKGNNLLKKMGSEQVKRFFMQKHFQKQGIFR